MSEEFRLEFDEGTRTHRGHTVRALAAHMSDGIRADIRVQNGKAELDFQERS